MKPKYICEHCKDKRCIGKCSVKKQKALIHFNDEAGPEWYSVELESDVGNWLDSFLTMEKALEYIKKENLDYDPETGFRSSIYPYKERK